MDGIIDVQIRKYPDDSIEIMEVRQEILMRMNRCNILDRFDSKKSALNTFITNTANGYVHTYFHNRTKNNYRVWNPWPSMDIEEEETIRYCQHYCGSLNNTGNLPNSSEDSFLEITPDNLDSIYPWEILDIVNKKMTPDMKDIFNLWYEGYSIREIAENLGTNPNIITHRLKSIKKTFLTAFQE